KSWLTAGLVFGGLVLLVAGGHALVGAAVVFAEALGVSEATIGLTVVAIGTSLPELSTSIIASLRGQADIAVGNVIGSNIFNSLGILGVTATIHPLQSGGIGWIDLGVMISFALVLTTYMIADRRIDRLESAAALAAFMAYMAWLVAF
ncbi:MAG: sodium:calcium antiporter, partial [Woeseiaceae bacterium]|nr:sodium:calcium antiporter [Woeseiaceae bacterium]